MCWRGTFRGTFLPTTPFVFNGLYGTPARRKGRLEWHGNRIDGKGNKWYP